MARVTVHESIVQPLACELLHDAYHRKRCRDARVEGPSDTYCLTQPVPGWVQTLTGLEGVDYEEVVRRTGRGFECAATTKGIEGSVKLVYVPMGPDETRVDATIEIEPRVGAIHVPKVMHGLLRTFIGRRFRDERRRELELAATVHPGPGEAPGDGAAATMLRSSARPARAAGPAAAR